jgi:gliding motility-associated-like protein
MKKELVLIFFVLLSFPMLAQYVVSGGEGTPLRAVNDTYNRMEVYLLNGLSNAEISFTSSNEVTHQWYKYEKQYSDTIPISCSQTGRTSTIRDVSDGWGYFVKIAETSSPNVWIIDYSKYVPVIYRLWWEESDDKCDFLKIIADVEAEPLYYYTPAGNGAPTNLQRTYHLTYTDLKWDAEGFFFADKPEDMELKGLISEITIPAPLQKTDFTLKGDAFAEHFGLLAAMTTPVYNAIAVEAYHKVDAQKESGESEQQVTGGDYAFSAPVNITFTAYANEPVAAFYIWKIIKLDDRGNRNTIVRYTEKELNYRFDEGAGSGTFIVGLEVMDRQAVCVDSTQTFRLVIGETDIKVPNFFSPGTSIGSNDEFRISYRSLVSFNCSIYNRWGNLLYQWNDPSKGWDGRVSGKYVPTGVYFYVIEYKGVDGKKKVKSGDINVLRAKN